MFKAKIYVTYKPSVLDPKAEVIKTALGRMAYNVSRQRSGRSQASR